MNTRIRGASIVSSADVPIRDLAEIREQITDLQTLINTKRGQLANLVIRIQNAKHNQSLHSSYHGADSVEVRSDAAIVATLELERRDLALELESLTKKLPRLEFEASEFQKNQAKNLAREGDKEIRASAKKMVAAVEAARDACIQYDELRHSFSRPRPEWPHAFREMLSKPVEIWLKNGKAFLDRR
jgi:hypothetical protein